jgi:hypothetical protein
MKASARHCGRDMNKILLNHAAARHARLQPAHLLLVAGLIGATLFTLAWSQVSARQAMLEASLERLRNSGSASAPAPVAHNAEVTLARTAMDELALGWEPLLQGLESIDAGDVRLLSVEPLPKQRKLRIAAETGEPGQMLAYVQALKALPMLTQVVLQRQERSGDGRQAFSVEAIWNVRHED